MILKKRQEKKCLRNKSDRPKNHYSGQWLLKMSSIILGFTIKFPNTRQVLLAKMNGIIEKNIVLKENHQI